MGVFLLHDALLKAEEEGLDLVEVAPNADPPVCRIMDYGKYKYQQKKRVHESKKKQTYIQLKEIKVRPKIREHDLEFKIQHMRRFLERGDKVKVTAFFRTRELSHPELGQSVLAKVREAIKDIGVADGDPRLEGRTMVMVISPRPKRGALAKDAEVKNQ